MTQHCTTAQPESEPQPAPRHSKKQQLLQLLLRLLLQLHLWRLSPPRLQRQRALQVVVHRLPRACPLT